MASKRGESNRPECFGCGCLIRSQTFHDSYADTEHHLCYGCTRKCRDEGIVPGGDFSTGELWSEHGTVADGE